VRSLTIIRADGNRVSVELDPRSTLHVTGRSRSESGSLVGGRTGVQIELRDVARLEFTETKNG
jgi:hypothetical protein